MRRRGFTLLEVVITIALVVMVVSVAASTLIGSASSSTRARLFAEQEGELLRVSSILRRQLVTSAISAANSTAITGDPGPKEPRTDSIDLVTSSLLYAGGVGEVEWRILHEGGQDPYLVYREAPYVGGESRKNNPWIPFSKLITGLEVRYFSGDPGAMWVDTWHNDKPPVQVHVIFFFRGDGHDEYMAMTVSPGIALQPPGSQSQAIDATPPPPPGPGEKTSGSSSSSTPSSSPGSSSSGSSTPISNSSGSSTPDSSSSGSYGGSSGSGMTSSGSGGGSRGGGMSF